MFENLDTGKVFVIDVENTTVTHSFYDDGCVEGCSVAASPNGRWIACGSNTGKFILRNAVLVYYC